MRHLLRELISNHARGRDAIYCSVVETRGSTPQKPGAAMLVFPDGTQAGTLGGGCTEAEVRQRALTLFGSTQPTLMTYTLDDNYGWDDGLICGGRMTFLAQPVLHEQPIDYFQSLCELMEKGVGATEVFSIHEGKSGLPVGARMVVDSGGRFIAGLGVASLPSTLRESLQPLDARPKPYAHAGMAFVPVLPRCRLLIVGAGHVGQAVARLANEADFTVWILDDRTAFANHERFPMAERVWVDDIGRALATFEPDENTYGLIMTRGHSNDEEALYHLAAKDFRYLGLIGSRRKIRLIFEDLEKEGIARSCLDRVHAPLGIDIGSQTVPEIAISIVAHLIGHRNRGSAFFPPSPVTSHDERAQPKTLSREDSSSK